MAVLRPLEGQVKLPFYAAFWMVLLTGLFRDETLAVWSRSFSALWDD